MTTPVGGGIRSLNVALRQELDLYQCVRPVRYFKGVPSPLKDPSKVDMVIYRENTEDIYAGIEWAVKKIKFLLGVPNTSGIGIKPVSREGTSRLMRAAIKYAIDNDRKSVTIVHKGNIRNIPRAPSATGATNWRRRNSAPSCSTAARGAP